MTRRYEASGAGQHCCGGSSCAQRVMLEPMAAFHLLMKQLAIRLSPQAGKSLVIPQSAGSASNVSEVHQ